MPPPSNHAGDQGSQRGHGEMISSWTGLAVNKAQVKALHMSSVTPAQVMFQPRRRRRRRRPSSVTSRCLLPASHHPSLSASAAWADLGATSCRLLSTEAESGDIARLGSACFWWPSSTQMGLRHGYNPYVSRLNDGGDGPGHGAGGKYAKCCLFLFKCLLA